MNKDYQQFLLIHVAENAFKINPSTGFVFALFILMYYV